MEKSIIVYGSVYGSAQKYADNLAEQLKLESVNYHQLDCQNTYQTIIYIGSLYAGGVKGMASTFSKMKEAQYKELIIVTVGIADPSNPKNISKIKENVSKQLSNHSVNASHIFHLRGAINYPKLHFVHRLMMKVLYNKIKRIPQNQLESENIQFLETYNKEVDFINYDMLSPITQKYYDLNY